MIAGFFRRSNHRRSVDRLHGDIVSALRQPAFYVDYRVADTFDGRFELLALFSTLAVRRLARLEKPGPEMAQGLTDGLFTRLDDDLREMGVGDLTVPKRIKKLAAALLGRRQAYDDALASETDLELADALARNVYSLDFGAGDPVVLRLARYTRAAEAALANADIEAFTRGPTPFPDAAALV